MSEIKSFSAVGTRSTPGEVSSVSPLMFIQVLSAFACILKYDRTCPTAVYVRTNFLYVCLFLFSRRRRTANDVGYFFSFLSLGLVGTICISSHCYLCRFEILIVIGQSGASSKSMVGTKWVSKKAEKFFLVLLSGIVVSSFTLCAPR